MNLFEYDKELHERTLIEEGREAGLKEGQQIGEQIGRNLLAEAIMMCRSKKYTSVSELTQSGFDEETAKLALSIM